MERYAKHTQMNLHPHNLVPRAHITLVEIDTRSVGIKIIQRMIVIFVYSWIIVVTFVRNSAEKRLCVCWKSLVNGLHLGSLKLWTDFKTAKPLLKAPKTPNRRLQILYLAWLSRTNFWWTIPSKFNQNFPKTRKTFYIFYPFFYDHSLWILIHIIFYLFFYLVLWNNDSI